MTTQFTEGTPVRLSEREANAADIKSQLFYPHYRGLTGTVTKTYADGTATITIDPDSLPSEIRVRHQAGTDAMRQKWLDGLSDEARNKLSAGEKKFALRYSLLVGQTDLSPVGTAPPPPALAKPAPDTPGQASLAMEEAADAADAARKSSSDLDDAEARHLAEVARKRKAL